MNRTDLFLFGNLALGLQLQRIENVEELESHFQRGSSEYYCQIDDNLVGEIEADKPDKVAPDSHLELGYIELHDDEVSYDQCNSSSPIQVHTYEERVDPTDQEDSDDLEPKASSYDQLETAHRSEPFKHSEYKCLKTELKEPGYLQLQDDETEDDVGIANYEQCETSGPNPVHLYEKGRDTRDQEAENGDLEPEVSSYDRLEPTHRSKRLKPSEYKRLDTERVESVILP